MQSTPESQSSGVDRSPHRPSKPRVACSTHAGRAQADRRPAPNANLARRLRAGRIASAAALYARGAITERSALDLVRAAAGGVS